ncbi:MAG TPA: hypothetical protein V6C97_26945 [Oculatellaceae cyanobacterium]
MEVKDAARGRRARGWCFTLNNPVDGDAQLLADLACEYLVYGRERGASGTFHFQGFVYFANPLGFSSVRTRLGGRAHVELARGTPAQCRTYCVKDGDFVERGDLPQAGRRTDFMEMREMVNEGRSLKYIVDQCRSYQAVRGAEALFKYKSPGAVRKDLFVKWFWGPTGTGKTWSCFQYLEEKKVGDDYWVSSENLKWFDGYCGQSVVIIDDLRTDDLKFAWLLRVLDIYPLKVPVKGSFVDWCPMVILITSCFEPSDFACQYPREKPRQLLRRIKETVHLEHEYID